MQGVLKSVSSDFPVLKQSRRQTPALFIFRRLCNFSDILFALIFIYIIYHYLLKLYLAVYLFLDL